MTFRQQSLGLLGSVLGEAKKLFQAIQEVHTVSDVHWSQSDLENARAAGMIIDQVVHQLYFASGAMSIRQPAGRNEPGPTVEPPPL